jgi:hypothetical protein
MSNRFQVVGVNDERDFCECCGRTGLKLVVWILDNNEGEVKHFGTTCATAPSKGFNLRAEIQSAINTFEQLAKTRDYLASRQYRREGGKYVQTAPGVWKVADRAHFERCKAQWARRTEFNY